MSNPFLKPNIKHRILISFILILLISISFTLFNIVSLHQFQQHFTQFKQVSTDTNLMLKIDNDLSELQRLILLFSRNEHIASIDELNNIHKKMIVDISQLIAQNTFENSSDLKLLTQMQTSVNGFSEKFENLKTQRNLRDDYIDDRLTSSFARINDAMTLLSSEVGVQQDKQFIKNLWEAQLDISKAETISADYFNSREHQKKDAVLAHLTAAETKLQETLKQKELVKIVEMVNKTIMLVQRAKTTFNLTLQADRNYLFLTNIVIAGESAELSILSGQLKAESLLKQSELYADTEKGISNAKILAILTSIVSMFVAVMIAAMTGRFITKPLEMITETFTKLASGQSIVKIPGAERQDEIGELARAANVFNDTNLRTKSLLTESEEMTRKLEAREVELQKKNEDLNSFTRIASHDLKSPIQGIADLAEWIEEDLGDGISEEVKNNLKRIGIRVKRMQHLIDDLLKYSQVGKTTEIKKTINTNELIQEILELIVIPSGFTVNMQGDDVTFESFKTPLQTTLRNLLSNAIKHHHDNAGSISVTVGDKENFYVFEVQDDGPGVPASDQQNIFSLFQTGSKDKESTGMGLAFCKRMVEVHGGLIEVESSVGKGSVFRVLWPKNS